MLHGGRAGMEGDRRDARFVHEPVRQLDPALLPAAHPRAQLDRDRQAQLGGALDCRASDRHGAVGVVEQRSPGTRLLYLRHRAAHVDVDRVGPRARDVRSGAPHQRGVFAEQLDRDRAAAALAWVDAQQLPEGLLVAVMDRLGGDHLRDRHPRPVALGLEPHEPVADPSQRRQQHPVGHAQPA